MLYFKIYSFLLCVNAFVHSTFIEYFLTHSRGSVDMCIMDK